MTDFGSSPPSRSGSVPPRSSRFSLAPGSRGPATPAQLERAQSILLGRLGSRMMTGEEAGPEYRSDDSRIEGSLPCAVVIAESMADIEVALEVAHETGVPVTPRAGGSGRTGGAVPLEPGIVLATAGMNSIRDIDVREGLAVVGPGTNLAALHAAVEAEGWFYPPDPNSAELCCLAGNAAENAAGPRAFKYGSTRDYVLGLEAVLPGGARSFIGRRTKKGVTGYDITALLVGSEGTLAAFGDLWLRLIPRPEAVTTLLALFPSWSSAAAAVEGIVAARLSPRCIEFLDRKTLAVMRDAGNSLRTDAQAMLLIEVDGSEQDCERQMERVGACCDESDALEVVVAQSQSQRDRLWAARKQMSYAVRRRAAHKISEDVVVPRVRLSELLEEVERIGERHDIDALAYGHAGDGNLHVNFLYDDADQRRRVDLAIEDLFRCTVRLGGTLSGEHGIGLLKAPYLALEQSSQLIALGQQLKRVFDPRGIMNPGKIFPGHHTSC